MKKRIGSIVLVLAMLLSALPAAYAAEAQSIPASGLAIQVGEYYNTPVAPSATYQAGSGTVTWNKASRTLTLNNVM